MSEGSPKDLTTGVSFLFASFLWTSKEKGLAEWRNLPLKIIHQFKTNYLKKHEILGLQILSANSRGKLRALSSAKYIL